MNADSKLQPATINKNYERIFPAPPNSQDNEFQEKMKPSSEISGFMKCWQQIDHYLLVKYHYDVPKRCDYCFLTFLVFALEHNFDSHAARVCRYINRILLKTDDKNRIPLSSVREAFEDLKACNVIMHNALREPYSLVTPLAIVPSDYDTIIFKLEKINPIIKAEFEDGHLSTSIKRDEKWTVIKKGRNIQYIQTMP
ncbi:MAG: hypothetical protein PHH61_05600 [Candidatus Nanoarchaeia archaeon]|nr:hypothetical protein [Candidatus Nanoarchaeia archaeon]